LDDFDGVDAGHSKKLTLQSFTTTECRWPSREVASVNQSGAPSPLVTSQVLGIDEEARYSLILACQKLHGMQALVAPVAPKVS